MNHTLLHDALIYLAAAIIFVPIAKKLGMGSVLGYLLAGIIIGPFCFGFIGEEGKDIMHFAEFGVVMMLFLIGLELEPAHFWGMRNLILGAGSLQVCATTLLLLPVLLFMGFSWQAALSSGLALSMSSTAIVMQTLREKGLTQTASGKRSFAVLLFQDISVIPILALLPLLALVTAYAAPDGHATLLAGLPRWAQTIMVLLVVGLMILSGRLVIVPFLRFIGRIRLRELFTAAALLIVIGAEYLMELVGLSPALGAFLAGVVLANSEFRHELESDIEPFKGILLGLFFISVGASINFSLMIENPLKIIVLVCGIMALKGCVLFLSGKLSRLAFDQNVLFTLGLAQVGEFAFVLFSFIRQLNILSIQWTDMMMGVTAASMTVTPVLLLMAERFILPRFGTKEKEEKDADTIDEQYPVIIAGFGDFGSIIGRFLRANGIHATILDNDSDRVELLRKMGFKVFYGDVTRVDILRAAGADRAKILVAAVGSPDLTYDLVKRAQKLFPHITVMTRAKSHLDAYDLMDLGVKDIYRESLDTSVRLGIDVLIKLGCRKYTATRAGQNFIKYDEAAMHKLVKHRHDLSAYIFNVREQIQLQEQLLTNDLEVNPTLNDHAWDSDLYVDKFASDKGEIERQPVSEPK
ncbi:MAG: monovalent cation:proton antiporter-2 (CPA2) family protein [Thermodesulfobacteriota bacterium]